MSLNEPIRRVLPAGSWPSPISPQLAVASGRSLAEPRFDGGVLYVLEGRPHEGGRVVLVRCGPGGDHRDVTPEGWNVRSRAHEYGGGAYAISAGTVIWSSFPDGRLMRQHVGDPAGKAIASPPEPFAGIDGQRFADLAFDRTHRRLLAALEEHGTSSAGEVDQAAVEPRNSLVAIDLRDGSIATLAEGHDFFSDPRIDPMGRLLCWLAWDRPRMPWDGTELWVARLREDGSILDARVIAGAPDESIAQPRWSPDGSLVFASDRTGWWNLYRWREGDAAVTPVAPMEAEVAGPQWVFGLSTTGFTADGRVAAIARSRGRDRLLVIGSAGAREVPLPASELSGLVVQGQTAAVVARAPTQPTALLRVDLDTGVTERVRDTGGLAFDRSWLSEPRLVELPTTGGRTAFAWYYPPTNPEVVGPEGERPPLLVRSHGGPTDHASTGLDLGKQAFTSRGWAVVDVDYGGSTGYGRAYRDRLRGSWGLVDVDDCTNAALWLADQGLADPSRLVIEGGSAGGFTTLAALAFRDVFAAGISWFGVCDLEGLARFTHKFESRYLDQLVAPYPERVDVYRERSPIHAADRIRCPTLILQGADDRVVPQDQSDAIVAALRANGVPVAYLLFQGEGHGFRRAENRLRAMEAELSFTAQVLGFRLADDIEPVEIEGLERWDGRTR
jgi:dipeptidyl aminopeptidase/acylaminoacyl peptidase